MENAVEMIADRYASDPSALGRGTRRELARVAAGLGEVRRAIETETALIVAGVLEVDDAGRAVLPRLQALLAEPGRSWDEVGEVLAAEAFLDSDGRPYRKARLVKLAIASAGGSRYAYGRRTDETDGRLFDLLNLPREVGGAGGLAPIVRGCYDHAPRYQMIWRFADASDLLAATIVDDDADLPDEPAAPEG